MTLKTTSFQITFETKMKTYATSMIITIYMLIFVNILKQFCNYKEVLIVIIKRFLLEQNKTIFYNYINILYMKETNVDTSTEGIN
mgnify:CR=1 FL=1